MQKRNQWKCLSNKVYRTPGTGFASRVMKCKTQKIVIYFRVKRTERCQTNCKKRLTHYVNMNVVYLHKSTALQRLTCNIPLHRWCVLHTSTRFTSEGIPVFTCNGRIRRKVQRRGWIDEVHPLHTVSLLLSCALCTLAVPCGVKVRRLSYFLHLLFSFFTPWHLCNLIHSVNEKEGEWLLSLQLLSNRRLDSIERRSETVWRHGVNEMVRGCIVRFASTSFFQILSNRRFEEASCELDSTTFHYLEMHLLLLDWWDEWNAPHSAVGNWGADPMHNRTV